MSKVTTFSRVFPGYHSKEGQPTHFVEKIYNGLPMVCNDDLPAELMRLNPDMQMHHAERFCRSLNWAGETKGWPKYHTIRSGHRWKVGDKFSPRVWSGRPHWSPQITIYDDLTVEKVYDFEIKKFVDGWRIDFGKYSIPESMPPSMSVLAGLAFSDGLLLDDFLDWFQFPKPFDGQIIAWDENVKY